MMRRVPRIAVMGTNVMLSCVLLLDFTKLHQAGGVKNINPHSITCMQKQLSQAVAGYIRNEQFQVAIPSWIIKWKRGVQDKSLLRRSIVESEQPTLGVMVVRPVDGKRVDEWLREVRQSYEVEYIQPNQTVQALQAGVKPNDTLYGQQSYLRQIGMELAWLHTKNRVETTIALVDTGVDFNHPDLEPNLVKGVNLLDSEIPQDDNGHGTNVAGIIAAVGNNNRGTTGIAWSAKIMPIKALDSSGYGDEDKLGAGILYAIDHGAKIVVMSVGLYRYSKYMEDIVDYAEQRGVLLIAATGNDGLRYGNKIAIQYPAAYPTVLAVGGNTIQGRVEPRSNTGPEVDVVAPWHVFTTALGGGYTAEAGTSMAAPQVAGAAALLWSRNPHLKPYQIRKHLRWTAKDIEAKGWDNRSGYGMLRADSMLLKPIQANPFGTNTTGKKSRTFPINTSLYAELNKSKKDNWFTVIAPYDGKLELHAQCIKGTGRLNIMYYTGNSRSGTHYRDMSVNPARPIRIPVKKGKNVLRLYAAKPGASISYKISSRFLIYKDSFEPTDKLYQAYNLPVRTQSIVGTFSHAADIDWYMIQLPSKATLRLKMTTDTVRIDPAIEIQGSHIGTRRIDAYEKGQAETIVLPDLPTGKYYIAVQNEVTMQPEGVVGEYKLDVEVRHPTE